MSLSSLVDDLTTHLLTLQTILISYLASIYAFLPATLQTQLSDLYISLSPYLTRTNAQYALRLIVIVSTYILFRPHLESLFRRATNTPDARQVELENRLQFLRDLKEGKVRPTGGVEVVDGKVVLKPNRPAAGGKKGTGGGKVVRLVVPGDGEGDAQGAKRPDEVTTKATPAGRKSARRRKG